MAKNEYFKKRIITFGNTPTETMYVDFWTSKCSRSQLVMIFIKKKSPNFTDFRQFSPKFGHKWPNNMLNIHCRHIWRGFSLINQLVAYDYLFLSNFKHFWPFYINFCIFGTKPLPLEIPLYTIGRFTGLWYDGRYGKCYSFAKKQYFSII